MKSSKIIDNVLNESHWIGKRAGEMTKTEWEIYKKKHPKTKMKPTIIDPKEKKKEAPSGKPDLKKEIKEKKKELKKQAPKDSKDVSDALDLFDDGSIDREDFINQVKDHIAPLKKYWEKLPYQDDMQEAISEGDAEALEKSIANSNAKIRDRERDTERAKI